MVEGQTADRVLSKEPVTMLQSILVYTFCLLVGVVALAVCAWVAATGQLFTMDGLLLIAISLTLAAFFVGNGIWAVHSGEVSELLRRLRSRSGKTETQDDSANQGDA